MNNNRAGQSIGPYEITLRIGAGGMGEVYRARDTKLNRDVALKLLPPALALDPDGVARLRREAQVLASLNHPNIAHIYGLEEASGTLALALELVEGEDLSEHLKRGPLPLDEAREIARQIVEGLEAAHERGIIHRDLKPANIKITKTGVTKILDFGLAKAYGNDLESKDSEASQSPTMSRHMTEAGIILGTAAYMSPEQARGKQVDKRADIWAFGVVLFEMLTGKRLFSGETVTDTLAAVLTREPDFAALPASTPSGIRRLLKRCLQRDPKKRLRDIGDALPDLEDESGSVPATKPERSATHRVLPWAISAVAVGIAIWTAFHFTYSNVNSREVMQVEIPYPPDVEPFSLQQGGFDISPDGRLIAMIGVREGVRRLYIRPLQQQDAIELDDTAGVNSVYFSPDSSRLCFIPGSTKLTVFSLADKQRNVIVSGTDLGSGVYWSGATIFFSREGALWTVSSEGGTPHQVTTLDPARHEVLHANPLILPDGRTLIFSSMTSEIGQDRIESIPLEGGKRTVILEKASSPIWSPTGHLLFVRDGAVFAVPFDPKKNAVSGSAVPVIPAGVVGTVRTGSAGMGISSNGTLVYIPSDFGTKRVLSVGRDGSELALHFPPAIYGNPRISPDGKRLLVETAGNVIEALDLTRGTKAMLAAPAAGTSFPTWNSDGSVAAFRRFNVPYWTATDGSGQSGVLAESSLNDYPVSAGPDPESILLGRIRPDTSGDVFLVSLNKKFPPKVLVSTPAYEGGPEFSPDRNWLLYQSNETGQPEIYVRRYPALDRAWQVSADGGVQTRWSPSGKEIFYRNGKSVMAVSFDGSGVEPSFGTPTVLFPDQYDFGQGISVPNYDVTQDGRFIFLKRGQRGNSLHVVFNWTEQLKQIVANGGIR